MLTFILLMAFFGAYLVMSGIFQQKLAQAQRQARVEYRFIPRTLYEEQMDSTSVSSNMRGMFEREDPGAAGSGGTNSIQQYRR